MKNINSGFSGFLSKLKIDGAEDNSVAMDGVKSARGSFRIVGRDNKITLSPGSSFNGDLRVQGSGNKVFIGKDCAIRGQILVKGNNQEVFIGEGTTFQNVYILCQEKCNVKIGKWCMFSRGIEIRTTDAHSLVDKETGFRINKPASIEIGDHVWVSLGVIINKGVLLPDDVIVGANSFVNEKFTESSVVIAGAPAKIVKRGVTWNRLRKNKYAEEELYFWRD